MIISAVVIQNRLAQAGPGCNKPFVGLPLWSLAGFLLFPLPALRRVILRRRLTRRTRGVPADELRATLLPLNGDPEARKIVAPLLRQIGVPAEVVPSASPEGRGDEPSAADPGRPSQEG